MRSLGLEYFVMLVVNKQCTHTKKIKLISLGPELAKMISSFHCFFLTTPLHNFVKLTPGAYCIKLLPYKNSSYFNQSFQILPEIFLW